MPFENLDDLETLERHAYASGDYRTAGLAALAIDAQEACAEAEAAGNDAITEAEVRAERAEAAAHELQCRLDDLYSQVEDMPRVSKKAVLALLAKGA